MKKAKGLVFFVIALLILGLGYTSFFGVYSWYGATENTIIRGTKSLSAGVELSKTGQVVLTPEAGSEITAENLQKAGDLIEGRLSKNGYNSVELGIDATNKKIVVTFPLSEGYQVYKIKALVEDIRGKGVLTIRKGETTDENGLPTGEVIADNTKLLGALTGKTTTSKKPAVQILLNEDGTNALASATYQMSGETLTIWMDNTQVGGYTIDTAITDGKLVVSSDTMSMAEAEAMAYKINLGPLPYGFTFTDIVELSSANPASLQNILIVIGSAFALICILLIVSYRLTGVVVSLGLILESALAVILFTGYFPVFPVNTLTVAGIFGMVMLGLVTVALGVWQAERIKAGLAEHGALDASVRGGLKGMTAGAVDGFIVAGITAFLAMAAFGTSNYRLSWLQNLLAGLGVSPGGYAVYPFVFALLYGLIIDMIVVLAVQRAMIATVSSIGAFKKPGLFGGK
ncbi:MAG TPA: hypothetical protein PK854_04770 [Oscillospiraceae bacterium]|nr:hypothetical protein [Oscillospiraceae bacterium]HPS34560.1 hypothetical protein [Oscillospiraceae bacterium]